MSGIAAADGSQERTSCGVYGPMHPREGLVCHSITNYRLGEAFKSRITAPKRGEGGGSYPHGIGGRRSLGIFVVCTALEQAAEPSRARRPSFSLLPTPGATRPAGSLAIDCHEGPALHGPPRPPSRKLPRLQRPATTHSPPSPPTAEHRRPHRCTTGRRCPVQIDEGKAARLQYA